MGDDYDQEVLGFGEMLLVLVLMAVVLAIVEGGNLMSGIRRFVEKTSA